MDHSTALTWLAGTGLLAIFAQLVISLMNYFRAKLDAATAALGRQKISDKVDENTALTKQTQIQTDGLQEKLVRVEKAASFAAGKQDQVDRQTDIDAAVDASKTKPEISQ
jgi:malate synthase